MRSIRAQAIVMSAAAIAVVVLVRFGGDRDRRFLGASDCSFATAHAEGTDAGELERSKTLF